MGNIVPMRTDAVYLFLGFSFYSLFDSSFKIVAKSSRKREYFASSWITKSPHMTLYVSNDGWMCPILTVGFYNLSARCLKVTTD